MMLMSIFEIKILLCVDSTFGNLKLFSPLILYSLLITTEMDISISNRRKRIF